MFILNNLMYLLDKLLFLYMIAIVLNALMTFLPGATYSKFGQFISKIVYPFESLFKFAVVGMVDFSPVIAIVIIQIARMLLNYFQMMIQ
ncbi:YggT family protein [Apilactobacillus xinyiensis]|uniref:YggT family protein n=1 Tax=Apilactobacillus xinyiensis TaxID=2841032 RepID=A0ABT0I207_9LACO|nr:YggT family protein [Apilactobacillus xinyiensis]MCK8624747.1 YggT family protein [Apilactobacillus xinyiensis]MCL0318862.1 YggT family protein [Apilactobacillus xinyiensis]